MLIARIDSLPATYCPIKPGVSLALQNSFGLTLLDLAVLCGNDAVVGSLLAAGAAETIIQDVFTNPLHHAAQRGHSNIVEMLVSARPDWVNAQTLQTKYTPLRQAMTNSPEPIEIVETLLASDADLNIQDWAGKTALHKAISMCYSRIVEMLLAAGADVSLQDCNGWTVLHESASTGDGNIVERILAAGVNVSFQDQQRRTALHLAVCRPQNRNNKVVDKLLAAGVDISLRDNVGRTALSKAVRIQNMKSVEILLAAGADASVQDNMGQSALHDAIELKNYKMVDMLLAAGADVAAENRDGVTSLWLATNNGSTELARKITAFQPALRAILSPDETRALVGEKS